MKLRVNSSKRIVELHSELFNKLSDDQKRSYTVLSKKDIITTKEQIVTNEVVNEEKNIPNKDKKK